MVGFNKIISINIARQIGFFTQFNNNTIVYLNKTLQNHRYSHIVVLLFNRNSPPNSKDEEDSETHSEQCPVEDNCQLQSINKCCLEQADHFLIQEDSLVNTLEN